MTSVKLRVEKAKRKNLQQEAVLRIVESSELPKYIGLFGAVYLANTIPWSKDPDTTKTMSALMTTCAILVGLGKAGVGDNTTTAVAAAAGIADLMSGLSKAQWEGIAGGAAAGTILGILSGLLPALLA